MKVMVLGLNPSEHGGKSKTFKTLHKWMDDLDVKYYCFDNVTWDFEQPKSNKDVDFERIKESIFGCERILALGSKADAVLRHLGANHYSLPHPSGLNRQINNSEYLQALIKDCKRYIWG